MTVGRICSGVVAFVVLGSLGVLAAKGPASTTTPATATFRCYSDPDVPDDLLRCDEPAPDGSVANGSDRARDDRSGTYTGGSVGSTSFHLRRTPETARLLSLHLGSPIEAPRCLSTGNCNVDGPLSDLSLNDWELRTKPLTEGTWEDLPGGLFGMSCNQIYPALVHFTFWLPSANGHWGLNLNPRAYPETTAARLTRLGDLTWAVEAENEHVAELLSWNHNKIRANRGPSREGRYNVAFKFTINATSLLAGAKTCQ